MKVKNRKTPIFIHQVQFTAKQQQRIPFKSKSSVSTQQQSVYYSSRYSKMHTIEKQHKYQHRLSQQNILPSISKQSTTLNKKLTILNPLQIPTVQKSEIKRKIKHLRNKSEKYLAEITKLKQGNNNQKLFFINTICLDSNYRTQPMHKKLEEFDKTKEQSKEKTEKKNYCKKILENGPHQLIAKKINHQKKIFENKIQIKVDNQHKKIALRAKKYKQSNDIEGWEVSTIQKRLFFEDF